MWVMLRRADCVRRALLVGCPRLDFAIFSAGRTSMKCDSRRGRRVLLVLALSAAVGLMPAFARAQQRDEIAAQLATARVTYEERMQDIRVDGLAALKKMEDEARSKKSPDLEEIERIKGLRDEFEESGRWPADKNERVAKTIADLKQRAAKA